MGPSWLDDRLTINQDVLDKSHMMGSATVALCVVSIAVLLALCDREAHERLVTEFPRLPTIHGSNALAFAFSLALNTLSSIHASSLERRVLSTIMMYISLVAFLSYFAMANLPLATVFGNTGQPVFFMRFIEWALTCPAMLFWTSLVSCQTWREALVKVVMDICIIAIGAFGPFMWPPLAFCAALVAMAMFVYIMFHLFVHFGQGVY
jgi:bacteriorhodopsin